MRILKLSNGLVALLLLGTYLAPYLSLTTLGLLAIGWPLQMLVNLALALYWLKQRSRWGWLSGFPLLLGLAHLPSYVGLHPWSHATARSMHVVSINVNYFDSLNLPDRVSRFNQVEKIGQFLRQEHPDILCAQDFSADGKLEKPVLQTIKQDCGLDYSYLEGFSQATFSRYPIRQKQVMKFAGNSVLWTDVEIQGATLRVFNLHLQSYALGMLPDIPKRQGGRARALYERLDEGLRKRAEQAELVAQSIAASPYPVLVCGDFNDVPLSYVYGRISRGLRDGFRVAGWGSGVTYSGHLPFLRIDYILGSPQLLLRHCRVVHPDFSDHEPVTCDVSLE